MLQISSIIFLPPKSYGSFHIKHCKCWHEKTMTQSCQQESDDVVYTFPASWFQKIWTDFLAQLKHKKMNPLTSTVLQQIFWLPHLQFVIAKITQYETPLETIFYLYLKLYTVHKLYNFLRIYYFTFSEKNLKWQNNLTYMKGYIDYTLFFITIVFLNGHPQYAYDLFNLSLTMCLQHAQNNGIYCHSYDLIRIS